MAAIRLPEPCPRSTRCACEQETVTNSATIAAMTAAGCRILVSIPTRRHLHTCSGCDHRDVVPRFAIGEGFAVYRGATTTGHVHRHAAFQIAIGMQGEVAIVDASGIQHRAAALVVAPMEPHSLFADRLRERHGTGISAAPELRDLREDDVRPAGVRPSSQLDPRLVQTLKALSDRSASLPSLAADVGLSPQRLRALARHQLGMPLARWRVWTRLRRAAEALQAAQSLAEAPTRRTSPVRCGR